MISNLFVNQKSLLVVQLRAIIISTLILSSCLIVGGLHAIDRYVKENQEMFLNSLGSSVSEQIAKPFAQGGYVTVETILRSIKVPNFVESISVLDESGAVLINVVKRQSTDGQTSNRRFSIGRTTGDFGFRSLDSARGSLQFSTSDLEVKKARFEVFIVVSLS